MKVSELSGEALDYWVARAEGIEHPRALREMAPGFVMVPYESEDDQGPITHYRAFEPSSNWSDGGPIIDRHRISIVERGDRWFADTRGASETGGSPLEAAMRAFVAREFGDEVMG